MDPSSWGPPAWTFIAAIIQSYPVTASQQDQLWMIDFLTALGDALPCEKCRGNYKLFLYQNPIRIHVVGRQSVANWLNSYKQWSKYR